MHYSTIFVDFPFDLLWAFLCGFFYRQWFQGFCGKFVALAAVTFAVDAADVVVFVVAAIAILASSSGFHCGDGVRFSGGCGCCRGCIGLSDSTTANGCFVVGYEK